MSSLGDLISKVKPGGVSTPTKSLSDVITQAKSPSVSSPTPQKDPFFYKQFPNGSTVGKSNELDTSGVPLLGYRNPGDTATTTDKTRVATKFDPSTPQKLDPKTFLTPRAVKARATLKQTLGGGHSDELDHKISLELAGSNQPENLQVEPLVPGTTNTATDPLENSLAKDVANGKISLFDAHVQLAKAKKIPPPFTAGTVKSDPNWIEKAWDGFKSMIYPQKAPVDKSTPVAGTTDPYANIGKGEVTSTTVHAKSLDVRDPKGVYMGTFTGDKAYEQAQKKASEIGGTVEESNQFGTAGRLASKAAESAVQIIKGVSNSTADFLESAADPKATPQDRALKLGKIAVSGLWGIFAAEYPIFTLATSIGGELPPGPTSKDGKELPSLRTAILGINKLFEKGVEGSQKEAELNINAIPDSVMSRETKDKVIPLVGDLVTVLNMFAAGSLAHTIALPETQQKLGEIKDAVWNEAKNIKNLPNKQGGFISAPGTPEESRTPNDSIRTGEPVHPDEGKITELLTKKSGEIKDAFQNKEIGNIDLIWGEPTVGTKKGYGLAKIQSDHPDVIKDLPTAISTAKIVEKIPQRTILQTEGEKPIRIIIDHQLGTTPKVFLNNAYYVLREGVEPTTSRASNERSTIELPKQSSPTKTGDNSSISSVAEKSTSYPQALVEEAKKYKTADEFIKALDEGKAGLHVDYAPIKRFLESNTGSFNLEKVGFKPDEMITVYRGIDDLSGKVKRKINPGDYVATTKDLAKSYTGSFDDVVEMQIKAKDFYLDEDPHMKDDFSGEFTPERLSQVSLEGVYNPQKPISNSELVDLFNQVNKKGKTYTQFEGFTDLSTLTLEKLKGRSTVSKQFISDLTNSADLKQQERDIVRQVLADYPDGKDIPVKEFAEKVKADLVPLTIKDVGFPRSSGKTSYRYEGISLPEDQRGEVENYKENVYESPIPTTAGGIHFDNNVKNYFGHTRVEDIPGDTRRIIEVQSDLYQKRNLDQEINKQDVVANDYGIAEIERAKREGKKTIYSNGLEIPIEKAEKIAKLQTKKAYSKLEARRQEVKKLQQYSNPSAHFRMVREEVKQAAKDGKTKLQFPTGDTAMKIEGLGEDHHWHWLGENEGGDYIELDEFNKTAKIGETINDGEGDWIITDILGDGKFKAVPKSYLGVHSLETTLKALDKIGLESLDRAKETFDISGKVDTNNPIYRFYEKDLGRYLKNTFDAKPITDAQGVTWYEVNVKPEYATKPVTAFKLGAFDTFKAKLANGEFNTPEAHALAEVSKLFGPQELKFLFRDDLIKAFEGKTALGKYTSGNAFKNPMIEMVRVGGKVQDRTLYHESFHAYLDNFVDPAEKAQLLYKVNKNILTSLAQKLPSDYPKGLVRAEEWLADDFADWMKTNKSKAGGEYIPFYKRILNAIRGFIRKITGAQSLYDRIINRDRSYKKPTAPRTLDYARFKLKPDEGDAEIKINQLMSRIALVDNPSDIENILRNEVGYPESEIPGMVEKLVDVKNPDTIRRILEGEEDISPSEKKKKLLEYIPEEIFMRGSELELRKEALDEDPARFLSKYARNGKLPEVLGSGIGHGVFKTRGDDIVTEHGFKDSEEARDAFDKYLNRKTKWKTDKALYERDLRNFTEEAKRKLRQVTKLKNIEIQREEAAKKGVKNFADNKTPLDEMHVGTILKNEYGEKISANPSLKDKTRTIKDFILFYKKFTLSDQVGLHDYFSTPKYVLEKMNLGRFASDLRNAQDAYLNELPKHIETIQEWRNMVPGKDENHKLFKYLDGQPATNFLESVYNKGPMFDKNGVPLSWDDILNPMEKQVAGEIKQWYADFAFRLNLPEDQRITWYITHLFDFHAGEGPEFDPDMAAIMRNKIPGSVYDPFLIQRLGKYGYIENTWLALEAYAKRGTRKANLDPILDQVGHLVKGTDLEDSQWKFLKQHLDGVNMRPTGDEQLANTMIKQLFGYRFGPRPYLSFTGKAQRVLYRALLGLNMKNALKNLTQGINTYAILGEKHTMIGYAKLVSKQFDSEEVEEMLNSSTNVTTEKPTAGRRVMGAADKVLFSLHNATEFINRTSAYLGAKSKGKEVLLTSIDKAKSEKVGDLIPIVKDSRMIRTLTNYRRKWGNRVLGVDDVSEIVKMYAKEVVADTQFRYDNVDLPPVLKYPTVKLFAPFSSFAVKETEFIAREVFGKNWQGMLRFGLATALMIYLVGKDLNISWGDYIPVYSIFQNRFSSTPATLNLPTTIFGSLTNSAGLFGKGQTAKARLDAVFNAIVLSLPAGLAGQRAYQGVQKLNALGVENQVPKTLGNMAKAVILGKTSLQTRKDEMTKTAGKISDLMKQGKKADAETLFKSLPDVDKKEVIKIEKSKKAAQKSALTKDVKPLILKAKELIQQGNKEEAKALFQKLSPEEKQRFQKLYNTTK